MIDLRQSPNYAKYMRSLGWIVENGAFIKKLWFTSIIKIQRGPINLDSLKKYHPFLIKLEPSPQTLVPNGFHPDNWPLLPSKTLILDVNKINLSKDVRYEIRKASHLKVTESKDIESFYKMLEETMKIGHWQVPIKKEVTNLYLSFQPNNSVILQTPYSACLLVWYQGTAHYMYAALTKEGRKNSAAYLTLYEAIKFCQKKKLKYLDLEGIYDERYKSSTKNWQGFTSFKKKWGGQEITYPGSYTSFCIHNFCKRFLHYN